MQTIAAVCDRLDAMDACASSISSGELSPISRVPRPDSPRLRMADEAAVARARLRQLAVWGDAAEDEREEEVVTVPLPQRLADRGEQVREMGVRRKSLFCANRCSDVARRPSLWDATSHARMQHAAMERRNSIRRGKSFHRYSRISGNMHARQHQQQPLHQPYDDLVDGLDATKVTETPLGSAS